MKKNLLKKLWLRTLMLVAILLCGAGSAWGETTEVLTLDCATPAPSGTTSTALSNSNDVATFLNSAAGLSSATNIITCSDKSGDIYKGKGSGGGAIPQQCLKVGKASGGGSFTFTIPSTYDPIDVIELTCYGWKTTSSISINSGTAQTFSTAQSVMTKTFELSAPSRDITIAVTTSAVCITEIVLKKSSSGGSNLQASDLALGSSALSFDLYNNSAAQTVSYTTSSTGAVTVSGGTGYVTTSVNGNTITVTPTAVTPSAQTIIVSQAADDTYAAGSASFTVTVDDSAPFVGSYFIFNTDKGLSDLGITKPGNSAGTDLDADVDYTIGDVTMNVTHGSGTNTRVWAGTNGATDLRVYKGGTLKFTVPTGYSIKKITFAGSAINIIGLTDGVWTRSGDPVNTVSLTNNDTGSKINTITVEYESDNTPMISAEDVNLTYNETSGSINYSVLNPVAGGAVTAVSSENWLTVGTPSSGTIAISCTANSETTERTATVTLTYTYGDNETVTKTVTVTQAAAPVSYTTIPALFEAATSTETAVYVTFNNWVVSGVSTNGKNVFVTDNAGNGFVIFDNNGGLNNTYAVGSILSGTAVPCSLKKYSGYAELLNVNATNLTITTGGTVAVQNIAQADLAGVNTGALVSYENLTCSVDNNKYYLSDGTTTLQVYNSLFAFEALEAGKIYNITGVYQQYNTTKEILPRSADDIEKVDGALVAPTFTPAAGTYTEAQTVTITCETEGATIYYTTDGTEPTAESTEYTAPINVSQTTTIKAIAIKGTDESAVAQATYHINSLTNPYTVAQALAFNEYPVNGVYVHGIVSTAPTKDPTNDGEMTYFISDDGKANSQLEVYKGKGLEQAAFSSKDDIQLGDIVTIYGNVQDYNGTIEFATGNYLVSFVRPPSITMAESSKTIDATLPEGQSYNTASIELTLNNCDGANLQIAYCDAEGNVVASNPYNSWITIDINEYEGKYYVSGHAFESNTGDARTAYAKVYVTVDGVNYYSDLVSFTQLDPAVTFELGVTNMSFPAEIVGGGADMRASFIVTINNYSGDDEGVNVAYCDAEGNILNPSPYTWITIAAKKVGVTGIVFQNNTEETPRTAYAKIYVTVNGVNYYSDLFSFTQEGAGSSAGEDVVIVEDDKTTFLFNTDGNEWGFPEGSTNKTVDENTFTANGVSITLAGSQGNGYYYNTTASNYLILGKAGAYLTLPAFDFAVGKIVVEGNSGASPNVVQNIFVGENAVSTQTTGATMTNSYVIADEYQEAGNIYTLKVLSAHNTQISKIIVYNATGEEKINPQLKYSATAATATLGEEFTAPTLSYLDGFDGTITYASDNEEVATIDNEGVVSLVSAGTAVITASFAGNDTYEAAVARYTLTVQNAAVIGTDKFELVADASTLAAGDVIILVGTYEVDEVSQTYALGTNQKTNNRQAVAVTINSTDGTITPSSDVQQITLEEGWYFNVGNGYLYAASKTANQLKTEAEADDNAKATISTDDDDNATIIFQGENTRNELRFNYNTGDPLFACYAEETTTGSLSHIYKKVIKGDVNNDGNVTIADVTALVNIILGKDDEVPYKYNHEAANVNGDDNITIADVTALVNIILGK